jgi:hypothetical protein
MAEEIVKPKVRKDDLSELFSVPQPDDNDMVTDHLTTVTDTDIYGGNPDMSDLTDIDDDSDNFNDLINFNRDDVIGNRKRPVKRVLLKRTNKPYKPINGISGMR